VFFGDRSYRRNKEGTCFLVFVLRGLFVIGEEDIKEEEEGCGCS